MTALLFSLGLIGLCIVLIVITVHHMVDTVMKLHDDLLDERLGNYGIKKYKQDNNDHFDVVSPKFPNDVEVCIHSNKEDNNDSDRT